MRSYIKTFFLSFVISLSIQFTFAAIKLPGIFTDNMVLQRDSPIHIWGWAEAGENVTVLLNGRSISTKTNKQGKWSVRLPAMQAGGPFDLIITGRNEIRLTGVLIGDIWICAGQSNMQWSISQTNFEETDTTFIKSAEVRFFTVQLETDYMPREDVKSDGWRKLNRENINAFSAVAYHFGKFLYEELNVPIGLISANLASTAVETWMSNEALLKFPQFKSVVEPIVKEGKSFAELLAAFEGTKPAWYKKYYYRGFGIDQEWFKPDTETSDWNPINAAGNTWEKEPSLKDHDGEVWFRTTFDLPENYTGETFHIGLSQIDDYDIVWVNGKKVGEGYGKHNHRAYSVPTKFLKQKDNVLVVRVFDVGGIGGFTSGHFGGNKILSGNWIYKKGSAIEAADFPKPNVPNATPFSSPGVLYNANIAPLTSFPIKGVIWYQGESNVDRAYEYRQLFPAMILDWRKQWNQGDFPFLFVQLANHLEESSEPKQSNWAELREAQAMAKALPNTGMATAIDIGEADDIHPKNKLDVGRRLGIVAMKVAYNKNVISSGPSFKSMKIDRACAIIEYDNIGSGLVTKDKYGYVNGFQMAGVDQKFYWAKAEIKNDIVIVTSEHVKAPVAVRYAWDNNPGELNLYNKDGLPAVPFRTDSWTGITTGAVFTEGPRF